MSAEDNPEEWVGFACEKCRAPLAVQRSGHASKGGASSARGWRVTCTACGETTYYKPGTRLVSITIAN